jgi:hypothetical protein
MKAIFLTLSLVWFTGTFCRAGDSTNEVPIITERTNVMKHVGEKITIIGKVSNTVIPQILGVDVFSYDPNLRGKIAQATGVLERSELTQAQISEMNRIGINNRGAGVFYRLRDEKNRNHEARVEAPKVLALGMAQTDVLACLHDARAREVPKDAYPSAFGWAVAGSHDCLFLSFTNGSLSGISVEANSDKPKTFRRIYETNCYGLR